MLRAGALVSTGRSDVRGQRLPLGHADVIVGPDGHCGGRGGCGFPLALADSAVRRRFRPAVRVVLLLQRPRRWRRPLRRRGPQVRVAVRGRVLEQRGRVAGRGRGRRFGRRRRRRRRRQGDDGLRRRHWVQVVQPVGRYVTVVAAGRPVLHKNNNTISNFIKMKVTKVGARLLFVPILKLLYFWNLEISIHQVLLIWWL